MINEQLSDELRDLQSLCSIDKRIYELCKQNKTYIRRHFVEKYIPDYKDKTNFIYTVGKAETITN